MFIYFTCTYFILYFSVEGREEVKKRTYNELHERVTMYAAAMRNMGVQKGDRVVGKFVRNAESVKGARFITEDETYVQEKMMVCAGVTKLILKIAVTGCVVCAR